MGLYLSFNAPSWASVALAIANAVLHNDGWLNERGIDLSWPMHGLPHRIHLGNAKEAGALFAHSPREERPLVLASRDGRNVPDLDVAIATERSAPAFKAGQTVRIT